MSWHRRAESCSLSLAVNSAECSKVTFYKITQGSNDNNYRAWSAFYCNKRATKKSVPPRAAGARGAGRAVAPRDSWQQLSLKEIPKTIKSNEHKNRGVGRQGNVIKYLDGLQAL